MAANSRFGVAVHVLALLEHSRGARAAGRPPEREAALLARLA